MAASIERLPSIGKFSHDAYDSYSLPGQYYFDPDIYRAEQTAIFYRTWQYVCHTSELATTGSYFVRDIGDQSVVVVRDRDETLRAFHNVCQHRAHRLVEGSGQVSKAIVCPYHSWSYELNGRLRHARHANEVRGFDTSCVSLVPVKLDTLCGFVFINLDPHAAPLSPDLEVLESEIRELSPNLDDLVFASRRLIDVDGNWKNSIENYSECYHCPNQHPNLMESSLDIHSYEINIHDKFHSHGSQSVAGRRAETGQREFGSWYLWPNWVLEVFPGGYLCVFYHLPVAPERTRQVCEWYFPSKDLTAEQKDIVAFVDVVRDEDIPLVESVQKGLHSLGYEQGRLMAQKAHGYFSEHAVHDFQRRVLEALRVEHT